MTTARIYEFLILARLLSYSKAADALYISQSALSKHIQELEQELGVSLFSRTTHGVALTEAGRVLEKEAPSLIDKCDSALRRLRSQLLAPQGSIRIAISLEFSHSNHIRSFFRDFSARYPDIELKYDVLPGGTPSTTATEYDLFFSPCEFHDLPEQVQKLLLRQHGTHVFLPPHHPLIAVPSVYLHQLAGQTLIVPHGHELFGPYAQNRLLAEKATKGQISFINVDNLHTALFLVTMGKGICIAPRYAQNMVSEGIFVTSISNPNCRFDEFLYYNDRGNDAAKLFFEEIKGTLQSP